LPTLAVLFSQIEIMDGEVSPKVNLKKMRIFSMQLSVSLRKRQAWSHGDPILTWVISYKKTENGFMHGHLPGVGKMGEYLRVMKLLLNTPEEVGRCGLFLR
jgi:hypothetical protein